MEMGLCEKILYTLSSFSFHLNEYLQFAAEVLCFDLCIQKCIPNINCKRHFLK